MTGDRETFRLVRYVRTRLDPFASPKDGIDSIAGLGLWAELYVIVEGPLDEKTSFVMDVRQIDGLVARYLVPILQDLVQNYYCQARSIGPGPLVRLLSTGWGALEDGLGGILAGLGIGLDPLRSLEIYQKEPKMVYYTECFEFSAAHTLWNRTLSAAQNEALFGRCANPNGHGHNYRLEVTVEVPVDNSIDLTTIGKVVNQQVIEILDHKNLNLDVPFFRDVIPTMEQIAKFTWHSLSGKLVPARLHAITVWESDRSCCSFYGPK